MSTPSIIIAEPDPMMSSVLRVEFTYMDFAVLLAASGQEAEDYAKKAVAHLIVLDAKLQLAAYEACLRIRCLNGYASRPIVLTSSDPSPRIKQASAKAGITVVLPKPYAIRDLFNAVRPFLPPDDLLFTHRGKAPGMHEPHEWTPQPSRQSASNSTLSRKGVLLPIVRGQGVSIPFVRKPVS